MKIALFIFGLYVFTVAAVEDDKTVNYEVELINVLASMTDGDLEGALQQINKHLTKHPKSRVGYLIKADIFQAQTIGLALTNSVTMEPTDKNEAVEGLRAQLTYRWRHNNKIDQQAQYRLPSNLLDMGTEPHIIVADLKAGRLYLYQNNQGRPVLVKDYYMTLGKEGFGKHQEGDNKTPVGIYHITGYKDGKTLPDLYGEGAFPINYPNRLDSYYKRTGNGIWLHGTPSNTYARRPWSSEGCFVLSNPDFIDISPYLAADKATPVLLVDGIEWVSWPVLQERTVAVRALLQTWEEDWESLDIEAYLKHYRREDINFGKIDSKKWESRKRRAHLGKVYVQVDRDITSLLMYPGEQEMFVVRYQQHYTSNNYSDSNSKTQYWQRDSRGQWLILFEGLELPET